jgi:hypothetical protein
VPRREALEAVTVAPQRSARHDRGRHATVVHGVVVTPVQKLGGRPEVGGAHRHPGAYTRPLLSFT